MQTISKLFSKSKDSSSITSITSNSPQLEKEKEKNIEKEAFYRYYSVLEKSSPEQEARKCCGLYTSISNQGFVPTSINISGSITDTCSETTFEQSYSNNFELAVEASFKLPLPSYATVNLFEIEYDGKKLVAQIKGKEEARQEYEDAIASGGSAFLAEKSDSGYFTIAIGNIPSKKDVTIRFRVISQLCALGKSLVYYIHRYCFPLGTYKVNATFRVNTTTQIEDVKFITLNNAGKKINVKETYSAEATYETNCLKENITLKLKLKPTEKPSSFLEYNEKDKNYAVALNFYPKFDLPQELINQKAEFIFLVDCSGSMSGSRISSAKKALEFAIRSLSENVKFNIYKFGSSHTSLFKESEQYDDSTLAKASDYINRTGADLGGTELFRPLKEIMSLPYNHEYPRQIFILTDGQVSSRQQVIDFVQKEQSSSRIFSLGISNSVDKELVIGLSTACMGRYEFIPDNDPNTEAKVMNLVNAALEPTLSNITFDWGDLKVEQAPRMVRPIYNGERMMIYAMIENLPSGVTEVALKGNDPTGEPARFPVSLDPSKAINNGSELVHSITATLLISDLEELESKKSENHKEKIVALGSRFGLVSKHTSYIVTADNNQQILDTPKQVELNNRDREEERSRDLLKPAPMLSRKCESASKEKKSSSMADCKMKKGKSMSMSSAKRMSRREYDDDDEIAISNDPLINLIREQKANGSFLATSKFGFTLPESPVSGLNADIWATIYIIAFLHKKYESSKDKWSSVVQKSIKWIKSKLAAEKDSNTYESLLELAKKHVK